jgi:hypothetical protein
MQILIKVRSHLSNETKMKRRLYLGGVRLGTSIEKIKEYMEQRGISPTFIRIFNSKRKGTIAVRVNIKTKILIVYLTMTFGQIMSMLGSGCQNKDGKKEVYYITKIRANKTKFSVILDYKREIDTQTPDLGINFPFVI